MTTKAAPSFAINNVSVSEGGSLNFSITKSGSTAISHAINYATANGSAGSSDYTSTSGTMTFTQSQTSKIVSVSSKENGVYENNETLRLNLSAPTSGASIADSQGVGTIINDDAAPSFRINNATVTEGGTLSFTVTKSGSTALAHNINYATANGSAGTNDYGVKSGTLSFSSSQTTQSIAVSTVDDSAVEANETVVVNLSSATNGSTIVDSQGIGTIYNNDEEPGRFSVNNVSAQEGANIVFTVQNVGGTDKAYRVNYRTVDQSADAQDYLGIDGVLNFGVGQASKTLTIATYEDSEDEVSETFQLVLSSPTNGATLVDGEGLATIADDDTVASAPDYNSAIDQLSSVNGFSPLTDLSPTVGKLVGAAAGEFRVNESGAATYSVPINLPAGVAGSQPSVSLLYSSQNGNGIMGLGWSLGAGSAITRCRQTLYQDTAARPIELGANDRFCLDGQRLILISGTYGSSGSVYKTEIDNYTFIKAIDGPPGDPNYFKVIGKDGAQQRYGATPSSSVDMGGKTYSWSLTDSTDSVGNIINYVYAGELDSHRLTEIRYANGAAKVLFSYSNGDRPDVSSGYVAGYKLRHAKRLTDVTVQNNGAMLRFYTINYLPITASVPLSRVDSIEECASSSGPCLPPLRFEWAEQNKSFSSSSSSFVMTPTNVIESCSNLFGHQVCSSVNRTNKKLMDFKPADINGDGCSDLIYGYFDSNNSQFYVSYAMANNDCTELEAEEFFDEGLDIEALSFGLSNKAQLRISPIDYNADGRTDVALRTSDDGDWNIYLARPHQGKWQLDAQSSASVSGDNFFDIDGNGLADTVSMSGQTVKIRYAERDLTAEDSSSSVYQFGSETTLSGYLSTADSSECSGSNIALLSSLDESALVQGGFAGDFNGDGQADLVNFTQKTTHCGYVSGSSGTTTVSRPSKTAIGIHSVITGAIRLIAVLEGVSEEDKVLFADLNGDGLTDVIYQTADNVKFSLSTGAGFVAPKTIPSVIIDEENPPTLVDYNHDGFADLMWHDPQANQLKVLTWNVATDNFTAPELVQSGINDNDSIFFMDVNGNGVADKVRVAYARDTTRGKTLYRYADQTQGVDNVIESINNGLGNISEIHYKRLNEAGEHYSRLNVGDAEGAQERCWQVARSATVLTWYETICEPYTVTDTSEFYRQLNNPFELASNSAELSNPVFDVNGPMYVVTEVESSAPLPGHAENLAAVTYAYQEAKMQAGGRGFLGFRQLSTRDEQRGVTTSTIYKQQFPFQGMPESTRVETAQGHTLSIAVNTYDNRSASTDKYYQPFVMRSTESSYALANNGADEGELLTQVLTDTEQDSNGNITRITVKTRDTREGLSREKTTTNKYLTTSYSLHEESLTGEQLGRLERSEVTGRRDDKVSHRKVVEFRYAASGDHVGMLTEEKVLPQADVSDEEQRSEELTTAYTYDDHGNKKTVSTTGWNGVTVETRQVTYNYDSSGRYSASSTNGLNQTLERASNFNKFGLPQTVTSANGVVTTIGYDALGREISRSSNTGGWNKSYYLDCRNSSECPVQAQIALYKISADGAQSIDYLDALGRSIRKGSIGFNGQRIYTDTQYDELGRVTGMSEPYFEGAGPTYWTRSSGYDALDRVQQITAPDNSITTVTYSGLSIVTTNALLQTSTEIKNGLGELVEVRDHNGARIRYAYDAEGNMTDATVFPTCRVPVSGRTISQIICRTIWQHCGYFPTL